MNTLEKLLNLCERRSLTPNQLFLLYFLNKGKKVPGVNVDQELRVLKPKWLSEQNKLTTMSSILVAEMELENPSKRSSPALGGAFKDHVEAYRELFPKGILPSKKSARQPVGELEKKFIKFFLTYPQYSWETIMKATKYYVDEFSVNSYMYMRTSKFFIEKQDKFANSESELAAYCELVQSGEIDSSEECYQLKIK